MKYLNMFHLVDWHISQQKTCEGGASGFRKILGWYLKNVGKIISRFVKMSISFSSFVKTRYFFRNVLRVAQIQPTSPLILCGLANRVS
jgi:hypothetical protein